MLQGVFVLNEAGETVVSLSKNGIENDNDMLGGLVGAVQMFVQQMNGSAVRAIRLDDMMMHMRRTGNGHVVTLHDVNDTGAEIQSQRIAKLMEENQNIGGTDGFIKLVSRMLEGPSEWF